MIELPGSFSGILISPIPDRGPDASHRMSLAILCKATASTFRLACAATIASQAASAANLFGALTNGMACDCDSTSATSSPKPGGVFRPVPTAVPPIASGYRQGKHAVMTLRACDSCAT